MGRPSSPLSLGGAGTGTGTVAMAGRDTPGEEVAVIMMVVTGARTEVMDIITDAAMAVQAPASRSPPFPFPPSPLLLAAEEKVRAGATMGAGEGAEGSLSTGLVPRNQSMMERATVEVHLEEAHRALGPASSF